MQKTVQFLGTFYLRTDQTLCRSKKSFLKKIFQMRGAAF